LHAPEWIRVDDFHYWTFAASSRLMASRSALARSSAWRSFSLEPENTHDRDCGHGEDDAEESADLAARH